MSSNRGALLPRVADATALVSPANGLIVYQTGGTPGFYYNAGTAVAPSWQQLATAAGATITATNGLTKTGSAIGLGGTLSQATTIGLAGYNLALTGAGTLGLGTTSPAGQLANTSVNTLGADGQGGNPGSLNWAANQNGYVGQFYNAGAQAVSNGLAVKINGSNADATALDVSTGTQTNAGSPLLTVKAGGNVGIGLAIPINKLDVSGTLRSLMTNGSFQTNDFPASGGINTVLLGTWKGNNGNGPQLRFQGQGAGTDYLDIGQNTNGDFVIEGNDAARLTVLNAGNVGVGTSTPTSTLQVAGSVAASIRTLSSATIAATDYTVLVTGNVSLPAPSATNIGRLYHLLNGNTGSNTITGTLRDAGTASTSANFTLGTGSGNKGITVQSDGTQWWIITRE